ncbi:MAG: lipoyl(octanoyl) transferase LipB [Desulfovibrionaceae bacterium]|nr:lipoyl(octanoyl) transferase LipB [Desulfovibrionaceae bacterium]MBF0513207.1 lipoyl(octanoyl) transferase LipB [Desulfovibrionaceae bacterium]
MIVTDLGRMAFGEAWKIQEKAVAERISGGPDRLFLVEHDPVVTLGRNGGGENLLVSPEVLAARGVGLVQTTRGGNITCHFPGQVVAYPIFRIRASRGGLRGLFHDLEEVVIAALARYGVQGRRCDGRPGVFADRRKIASIGLAVRRRVTAHGLALNVGRDLGVFSLITPCGLHGVEPTSMLLEMDRQATAPHPCETQIIADVKQTLVASFENVFDKKAVLA